MGWEGSLETQIKNSLGYFALGIGFGWAYEAEVKAIIYGLQFCQQFLFRNVILKSDSTTAIGWVILRDKRPWRLINELNRIDLLMKEMNCMEIRLTYREGNIVGDYLANKGCERMDPMWVLLEDRRES